MIAAPNTYEELYEAAGKIKANKPDMDPIAFQWLWVEIFYQALWL
ncbi:MAG: hypothetical protein CM1200mP13_17660 [Candidatus Pelagibacterales bacterium]|nr:MAG: hypothetical protein CM1200mP13_17660 [Pelagibacterales bacterium]